VELAQVLRQGTNRSLVLLDEIGRGTSTYDGLCIAQAVMETLSAKSAPLTLFATHYHELTQTAQTMPGVANASVLVKEEGDVISFLHTVVNRPADRSYGIQVAKLAGVPHTVIQRAQQLLQVREAQGDSVFAQQGNLGLEVAATVTGDPIRALGEDTDISGTDVYRANTGRVDVQAADPRFHGQHPNDDNLSTVSHFLTELSQVDVMKLTPIEAMNELHRMVEKAKGVTTWDKSK
jgi:DNA mismatch repair protein MutS